MAESRRPHRNLVQMPWDDLTDVMFVRNDTDEESLNKWELIKLQLGKPIRDISSLERTIRSYYVDFRSDGSQFSPLEELPVLRSVVEGMSPKEQMDFFGENGVLQSIQNLALKMPETVRSLHWLSRGKESVINLHQMQVASILANSFFCTFPKRDRYLPSINFSRIYEGGGGNRAAQYREKLKCLIHYFKRIHEKQPCGYISYYRRHTSDHNYPRWNRTSASLTRLTVDSDSRIEDLEQHVQMDFANKVIGGGVIGSGCVQEEIRFVICPELIAARLFCEPMAENEAIIIIGVERFCSYSGYADTFQFTGNYEDFTPFDSEERRKTQIVAVDALFFRHPQEQYRERFILRELKKVYSGLKGIPGEVGSLPVATGNWGCGAFRGDVQLKSLLQIMAASQVSRKIVYCTFGDLELKDGLLFVYNILRDKSINVGQLYRILVRYQRDRKNGQSVFEFVFKEITKTRSPREFATFSNQDELATMEGGQKRSKPSTSKYSTKQARKDAEPETPRTWFEKEKCTPSDAALTYQSLTPDVFEETLPNLNDFYSEDFIPCTPEAIDNSCTSGPRVDALNASKRRDSSRSRQPAALGSDVEKALNSKHGKWGLLDELWSEEANDSVKSKRESQKHSSKDSRKTVGLSTNDCSSCHLKETLDENCGFENKERSTNLVDSAVMPRIEGKIDGKASIDYETFREVNDVEMTQDNEDSNLNAQVSDKLCDAFLEVCQKDGAHQVEGRISVGSDMLKGLNSKEGNVKWGLIDEAWSEDSNESLKSKTVSQKHSSKDSNRSVGLPTNDCSEPCSNHLNEKMNKNYSFSSGDHKGKNANPGDSTLMSMAIGGSDGEVLLDCEKVREGNDVEMLQDKEDTNVNAQISVKLCSNNFDKSLKLDTTPEVSRKEGSSQVEGSSSLGKQSLGEFAKIAESERRLQMGTPKTSKSKKSSSKMSDGNPKLKHSDGIKDKNFFTPDGKKFSQTTMLSFVKKL